MDKDLGHRNLDLTKYYNVLYQHHVYNAYILFYFIYFILVIVFKCYCVIVAIRIKNKKKIGK